MTHRSDHSERSDSASTDSSPCLISAHQKLNHADQAQHRPVTPPPSGPLLKTPVSVDTDPSCDQTPLIPLSRQSVSSLPPGEIDSPRSPPKKSPLTGKDRITKIKVDPSTPLVAKVLRLSPREKSEKGEKGDRRKRKRR